jgi:hypothetical protein
MSPPTERPTASPRGAEPALDRELPRALQEVQGPLPAPDDLFATIEQDVRRERGLAAWLRSLSTPARLAIAFGASSALLVAAYAWFVRPDLAVYPVGRMLAVILVAGGAVAASLLLALRPSHRPPPPSWAAPASAGLGLLGLVVVYMQPALPELDPAHAPASGLESALHQAAPCLGIGLLIAFALYALWSLLDRGGARRGLAAAAAAGLTANLALQLHCPITAPAHLLLGHLSVALVILAVALVARR